MPPLPITERGAFIYYFLSLQSREQFLKSSVILSSIIIAQNVNLGFKGGRVVPSGAPHLHLKAPPDMLVSKFQLQEITVK